MVTLPGSVETADSFAVVMDVFASHPQVPPSKPVFWTGMSPRSFSHGSCVSTASTTLPEELGSKADCLKDCQYVEFQEQLAYKDSNDVFLDELATRLQKYKPANLGQRRNMGHLSVNVAVCREKVNLRSTGKHAKHNATKGVGFGERFNAKMTLWEHKVQSMFKKFAKRGHS